MLVSCFFLQHHASSAQSGTTSDVSKLEMPNSKYNFTGLFVRIFYGAFQCSVRSQLCEVQKLLPATFPEAGAFPLLEALPDKVSRCLLMLEPNQTLFLHAKHHQKDVQGRVESYHQKRHGLCASFQEVKGLSLHLFHYLPCGMVSLTVLCLVAQSLLVLSLPLGHSSNPDFCVYNIHLYI